MAGLMEGGPLAIEVIEMLLHDGLRDLEATWQGEEDGQSPPAASWAVERDRLRKSIRQVVLYALVIGDVDGEDVSRIARSLQAQGLSDPLAEELQKEGLADLAAAFRERLVGGDTLGGEEISG